MSHLLALDPGVTTGYALFRDGVYLESGDVQISELKTLLSTLLEGPNDVRVVVEKIPLTNLGKLDSHLRQVLGLIQAFVSDPIYVAPTTWKTHPVARVKLTPISTPSKHQGDAYRMGLFVLWREKHAH